MTGDDAGEQYVQGLIACTVLAPAKDNLSVMTGDCELSDGASVFFTDMIKRCSKMYFLTMMRLRLILRARPYGTFRPLVKAKITRKNGKNPPYHAHHSTACCAEPTSCQPRTTESRRPRPRRRGASSPTSASSHHSIVHRREQGCYPLHPY